MLCGAQINLLWNTGRRGVGVARLSQQVGDRVHSFPRAKLGELQDLIKGVRYGVSVRVGDIICGGVDSGVGYRVGISNGITVGIDNEYTLGYLVGSFVSFNCGQPMGSLIMLDNDMLGSGSGI